MKQFKTILAFELKGYLKNKIFVGVTVFMVLVLAVLMFFPQLKSAFAGDSAATAESGPETSALMLLAADAPETAEAAESAFRQAFPGYTVAVSGEGEEAVRERIAAGEADCAFFLHGLNDYTYYVDNLSMYDENTAIADALLQKLCQMEAMVGGGLSPEAAETILALDIRHETVSLGKDQMQNFFYTYVMIFALYMVILLYGQMVATNVATEKSSRAMELLITSARPTSMMFGKVIASGLAGLIQLVAVFGSALLFFNLNRSAWEGNMIIGSIFDMPPALLAYMLLFFVLGFFIYAFLYGAIGSTASKVEDINTSSMPITLLFIAAFFVVIFSMSSGEVDNVLMKVCSFIPFTSPMAMFTRIAMSTVPFYEIAVSVVILIASVFGIGVLAARIYRVGVLLYGAAPKPGAIWKAIAGSQ